MLYPYWLFFLRRQKRSVSNATNAFPGRADAHGLLPRIDTDGEDEYTVYWGDEALAKMDGQNV